MPLPSTEQGSHSGGKGKRKKPPVGASVGPDGQRDRYFPDDHKFSLNQMFQKVDHAFSFVALNLFNYSLKSSRCPK